ncbi:MAG: hypothetical protein HWN66_10470 [Candidatus Helarchaeota archaeon]|nr:hypothetical protein [Candidatus Helarchaeota archaeon]
MENEALNPLNGEPIINNVTANAQYFKNGDLIQLFVNCDQANYSLFANFSKIDSNFSLSEEKVLDYNNRTYRINYTLYFLNLRPDGTYQVIINATNTTSSQFTLYNDLNLTLDNTPPITATIISPSTGDNVSGIITIIANATDNVGGSGVKNVTFWDGLPGFGTLIGTDTVSPYSRSWDTTSAGDGLHNLCIRVLDFAGNYLDSAVVNVTVDNTAPITPTIDDPSTGAYLRGIVIINATATDNVGGSGVKNVTFYDGLPGIGTIIGTDNSSPYSQSWDTTTAGDGSHALYVRVYDRAGNANTSQAVDITLDNTIPNLMDISVLQNGGYFLIFGNANGTFSPISNLTYNISEFIMTTDPTGELSGLFVLDNSAQSLGDDNYILTLTIKDSVNLTNSLDIPLTVDETPPTFDEINHTPAKPEYDEDVQVTIYNASDAITGIKNITLYYSVDGGMNWTSISITANRSGIIPKFNYQTEVLYYIELFDRGTNSTPSNKRTSENFNYIVNDTRLPVLGPIQRYPLYPTQHMTVNISIAYANDTGTGIATIFLNYSVDGGKDWHLKNITENKWGIIESQPPYSTVLYQIIVIDKAGNKNASEIMDYSVQFDSSRLLIFLIVIGAVIGITTFSGRKIYTKRKLKNLQMKFLEEKEKLKTYIDFRMREIDIILNDISTIELQLDTLLKLQWISQEIDLKHDNIKRYQLVKGFLGVTQLSTEIQELKILFDNKIRDFNKIFHPLKSTIQLSPEITRFHKKLDTAIIALGSLKDTLREKYSYHIDKRKALQKIKYPIDKFDQLFAKCINTFQVKYGEFAQKIDQLLVSRQIKGIETRINDLELLFKETDEWLKNAENWSRSLPLPKDRGYKYLLKLKQEQYSSLKNDFELKIERFRAELASSIAFAQNFFKWNYENLKKRLIKLETMIYEEALRYISSEDTDIAKIDSFLEEKFTYFNSRLKDDKVKIEEFYESHREFSIQKLYKEWTAFTEELPSKLNKIRQDLGDFIQPLYKLFRIIKGTTINFYKDSLTEIEKHAKLETRSVPESTTAEPLNILFSRIVWKIKRIDNEITDWINLLPFDLETPQLVILLSEWNEIKKDVLERLNTLSKEQKIYKCEIMHEILDPLNDEIWVCSNCGAVACTEHLERWYHRKKAPECFKCGKTNTFKLKILTA